MTRAFFPILLICIFGSICTWAKRIAPKDVPPVDVNGIRFSAHGDGRNSYIVASDPSGRVLWRVKVFHTRIEFWRGEEDNQWVFISDLKSAGDSLLVRDEKNRCYSIQLGTRHVKKAQCDGAFAPQEPRH